MSGHRDPDGSGVNRKKAERLLNREPSGVAGGAAGSELDRLLAAAARPIAGDPERARIHEEAALAAFRAARVPGAAATEPRPQ
ncbi:hypothetical protein GTY57_17160, partial [Streptomyces sp. SID5475]|nr:hypothetical protein [Streptomyces sp. SID5475]